jgi:hypothetical protein
MIIRGTGRGIRDGDYLTKGREERQEKGPQDWLSSQICDRCRGKRRKMM